MAVKAKIICKFGCCSFQFLHMNKYQINLLFFSAFLLFAASFYACNKKDNSLQTTGTGNTSSGKLSYGDSIVYIKNSPVDYKISPLVTRKGKYTAYPAGLAIDGTTGDITISRDNDGMLKTETGLRYLITFEDALGNKENTFLTLSGINYADHLYFLSQGDTIADPIYNNAQLASMPCTGSGCVFDEENVANSSGLNIKTNSGIINLAQTVRNGLFGATPENSKNGKEVIIKYRLNDKSSKAVNGLKVLLYYYRTIKDVPEYLTDLVTSREQMFLRVANNSLDENTLTVAAKPRPPCIIIVGQ